MLIFKKRRKKNSSVDLKYSGKLALSRARTNLTFDVLCDDTTVLEERDEEISRRTGGVG